MMSTKITKEKIDQLISQSSVEDFKVGKKTTVVCLTLPNGFEIVQSSSCVNASNYDHELGVKICKERIESKLWELEGYRLQNDIATIA